MGPTPTLISIITLHPVRPDLSNSHIIIYAANVSLWLNAWVFYTNVRGCIQFNAEKHPVCVSNSAQTIEHC